MGAGHVHGPEPGAGPLERDERWRQARTVTVAGAGLRVVLASVELTLGLVFGSRALLADTAHTLSDLFSDVVVWVALRFSTRPSSSESWPFGRGKVETLAALVVSAVLTATSFGIAVEAGAALVGGAPGPYPGGAASPAWAALGALLGIVVQEFNFRWTLRVGRRIRSDALIANAWHQRSDALSSVAALCGILASAIFQAWWLDSVAAMVVAGMILRVALDLLRESFRGLVDVSVPVSVKERISVAAVADAAVVEVHDVRARPVGHEVYVDLHAVVHPQMTVTEACTVAHRVEGAVRAAVPQVRRVLVHVEPAREGVIIPAPAAKR